jgi:hypothetical protein
MTAISVYPTLKWPNKRSLFCLFTGGELFAGGGRIKLLFLDSEGGR